jgi:quercetin dioxygenase-like cupin family protein
VHTVQVDNAITRVTRWDLEPGATTGAHRHAFDYVVVPLVAGRMAITGENGTRTLVDLQPGSSYYRQAGVRHEVGNGGIQPLSFVEVELLDRPAAEEVPSA